MAVNPRFSSPRSGSRPTRWSAWLDLGMLVVWSALLFKYLISGQIVLLLHPDFIWLTIVAGLVLLTMAIFVFRQYLDAQRVGTSGSGDSMQHFSLLPKGWSNMILIGVGLIGLLYTPRAFTSDVALQRGVTDTVVVTRSQPQAFRVSSNPQEKSITDWVRTLNVYPEPDAYTGQRVDVAGFAIHPPDLSGEYMMISRFILTCCAADAYPVGLPVKLEGDRTDYPADQWYRIKGEMGTETLNGTRRLTILATDIETIPQPKNPYDY